MSFPPVHIQPYHSNLLKTKPEVFPISYLAWKQLINLPISPLLTALDIERIAVTTEEIIYNQIK